jgi:hypothetical protein
MGSENFREAVVEGFCKSIHSSFPTIFPKYKEQNYFLLPYQKTFYSSFPSFFLISFPSFFLISLKYIYIYIVFTFTLIKSRREIIYFVNKQLNGKHYTLSRET